MSYIDADNQNVSMEIPFSCEIGAAGYGDMTTTCLWAGADRGAGALDKAEAALAADFIGCNHFTAGGCVNSH